MSYSPHARAAGGEETPLATKPGSGDTCAQATSSGGGGRAGSLCADGHHRKLAVCSIVCGCSCIGVKALISSVKAEEAADPETAARFSRRARKLGIISILVWICCLASIPILMALVSYLFTLSE